MHIVASCLAATASHECADVWERFNWRVEAPHLTVDLCQPRVVLLNPRDDGELEVLAGRRGLRPRPEPARGLGFVAQDRRQPVIRAVAAGAESGQGELDLSPGGGLGVGLLRTPLGLDGVAQLHAL